MPYTYQVLLNHEKDIEAFLKKIDHLRTLGDKAKVKILLAEKDAASLLSVSKKWLQNHRYSGNPPRYYKIHDVIRYNLFDLLEFLDSCLTHSTSQNEQRKRLIPGGQSHD